jgi:uncharacterized protein (DUF697 family)
MSRVIEVAFTGDPQAVVTRARTAAQRYGAVFAGDHVAGTFSGNGIEGHYKIANAVVVVTIDKKPDVVPWPMVEQAIRGFFESEPAPSGESDRRAREQRAERIIRKHIVWSTGAGLIPVPLADVAAVTAVQVSMLEDLSKLYGVELSEPVIKNFVTALTGGMIARIGASAVKAIPGIGTLLGGASMSIMSGASTYAIGQVAKTELERGGKLADADMSRAKSAYDKAYESGKDYVANLKDERGADDKISKLERLGELRAKGVLTDEEFRAQKAKLLDEP